LLARRCIDAKLFIDPTLAIDMRDTLIGEVDTGVLGKLGRLMDVMALRELTKRTGVAVAVVVLVLRLAVAALGLSLWLVGMRKGPPRAAERAREAGLAISVVSGMRNRVNEGVTRLKNPAWPLGSRSRSRSRSRVGVGGLDVGCGLQPRWWLGKR
jgi:type IV secretory pathway TrbD component